MNTNTQNLNMMNMSFDDYGYATNMTMIPVRSLRSKMTNVFKHYPVQLAAKSSKFDTFDDIAWHIEEEAMKAEQQMELDFEKRMDLYKKELAEQEQAHIMATVDRQKARKAAKLEIPTESEAFKAKREKAEQVMKEEAEKFRNKCLKEAQKSNPFGHRRNGGGKKGRRHTKETAPEVLQAARATRRKASKEQNKIEEIKRAEQFAAKPEMVKPSVVLVPKPIVEQTEEEIEEQKEIQQLVYEKIEQKPELIDKSDTDATSECEQCEEQMVNTPQWLVEAADLLDHSDGWEKVESKRGRKKVEEKVKTVTTEKVETREQALDALASEVKIREQRKYTKMCNSVGSGKPCRHGKFCRFAHSVDELTISECFFGCNCKFVECRSGVYHNTGAKVCEHKHPGESDDNYYTRTGLKNTRKGESNQVSTPSKPVEAKQVPSTPKVEPVPVDKSEFPDLPKSQVPVWVKSKAVEEETVIRATKEMAVQAMQMAMANGKKLIRIEII